MLSDWQVFNEFVPTEHPRPPLFFTPQFAFTVTAVLQLLCNIVNANQRVKTRLCLLIVNVNMQLTTLQII